MLCGGALIPLIGVVGLVLVLSTLQRAEWTAIGYALLAVVIVYAVMHWLRGDKTVPSKE